MPTIPLLAEFFRISVFFPPFRAELWKFRFFHEFLWTSRYSLGTISCDPVQTIVSVHSCFSVNLTVFWPSWAHHLEVRNPKIFWGGGTAPSPDTRRRLDSWIPLFHFQMLACLQSSKWEIIVIYQIVPLPVAFIDLEGHFSYCKLF